MRGDSAGRGNAAAVPPGGWAPLGSGPIATVYSGLHGGIPVALKVFPSRFDRSTLSAVEKQRGRLREVGSALPVHAVDQLPDGRHALRMELCPQSLAALLPRVGRLGPMDTVVLGHAVATALAGAHTAGVVHGGVKPSNVLFRASGQPVLADFGIALRQAFPRDPVASLEYLAPETLRTETLDERTDLYGLGALLHVVLTGRHPLPSQLGEPVGERVLRLLRTPVPAIHEPGVPVELSTVVGRLLAPDPARRPATATWVADRLGEMIARLSAPTPPTPPPGFGTPAPTPPTPGAPAPTPPGPVPSGSGVPGPVVPGSVSPGSVVAGPGTPASTPPGSVPSGSGVSGPVVAGPGTPASTPPGSVPAGSGVSGPVVPGPGTPASTPPGSVPAGSGVSGPVVPGPGTPASTPPGSVPAGS
ncbi:serine/threonine protein kinase, partial [Amycolatopsis ultiminotia]